MSAGAREPMPIIPIVVRRSSLPEEAAARVRSLCWDGAPGPISMGVQTLGG